MDGKMIYGKMADIMINVEAIDKDRRNEKQNYKFRGVDDVYNMLHSILAKHKVFTVSEILSDKSETYSSKSGGTNIYRILHIKYRFYAEDGSFVESSVIGEGMDSGDKASNKAMSVAHKYCLLQAFCIPTLDDKDPENDSHEITDNRRPENPEEPFPGDAPAKKDKPISVPGLIMKIAECTALKHLGNITSKYSADYHAMAKVDQDSIQEALTAKTESLKGKNNG